MVADAQYNSRRARKAAEAYDAESVIPASRDSRVKYTFKVRNDFLVQGTNRLEELFRKQRSVEHLFSHAKKWLMLDGLGVRYLEQVSIYAALAFMAMVAVAQASVDNGKT